MTGTIDVPTWISIWPLETQLRQMVVPGSRCAPGLAASAGSRSWGSGSVPEGFRRRAAGFGQSQARYGCDWARTLPSPGVEGQFSLTMIGEPLGETAVQMVGPKSKVPFISTSGSHVAGPPPLPMAVRPPSPPATMKPPMPRPRSQSRRRPCRRSQKAAAAGAAAAGEAAASAAPTGAEVGAAADSADNQAAGAVPAGAERAREAAAAVSSTRRRQCRCRRHRCRQCRCRRRRRRCRPHRCRPRRCRRCRCRPRRCRRCRSRRRCPCRSWRGTGSRSFRC